MKTKPSLINIFWLLVVILLGISFIIYLWPGLDLRTEQPYYAVHMENGEIYFGRISYFTQFALKDVYIVQSIPDSASPLGTNFQVSPLSGAAIWAPEKLFLNRNKVISISKVSEGSQVMQLIRAQ